MRRHLPGRVELVVLFSMALVCTGTIAFLPSKDSALALLTFPLFLTSAILGLWKHGRLRADDE